MYFENIKKKNEHIRANSKTKERQGGRKKEGGRERESEHKTNLHV